MLKFSMPKSLFQVVYPDVGLFRLPRTHVPVLRTFGTECFRLSGTVLYCETEAYLFTVARGLSLDSNGKKCNKRKNAMNTIFLQLPHEREKSKA